MRDAIDHHAVSEPERQALEAIADILRQARLSPSVALEERTIIVLESKRRRRRSTGGRRSGRAMHLLGGR